MATIVLSDGKTPLNIPDDATDAQAQDYYDQAEAALKTEGGDQPGWDWLRNNAPGIFTGGREVVGGIAEGIGNLPNAFPNTINRANEIIHLHTDEPGAEPPEPVMDQWMTGTGMNEKSLQEMNPTEPGWEKFRDYGRMTGTALPFGVLPALAVPALAKIGSGIGSVADYFTGDPAIRDAMPIQDYMMSDLPQGKWSQTGEFVAPLGTKGVVKGGEALVKSPAAAKLGSAAVKSAGPIAGLATFLKTGSLPSAYVAAKAAPATLKGLGKAASYAAPVVSPLLKLAGGKGLGDLLARVLAPATPSDYRKRGPR